MDQFEGNKYREITKIVLDGYVVLEVIPGPDGNPIDAVISDIGGVFEEATEYSLDQLMGQLVSIVLPEILIDDSELLRSVNRTISSGSKVKLEYYFKRLGKWFSVVVFCKKSGFLNIHFHDITASKKAAEQIKILSETALKYFEFPIAQIDYQMIAGDLLRLTDAKFTLIDTYDRTDNSVTTQAVAGDVNEIEKGIRIVGDIVGKKWEVKDFDSWIVKSKKLTRIDGIHELLFEANSSPRSVSLANVLQTGAIYRFGITHVGELLGNVFIMMPKGKSINSEIIELYASQLEAVLSRKRAETELNMLTNKYATVFNGSQDLMFLINIGPEGEFIFDMLNKKCEGRFHQGTGKIKGKTVRELFEKDLGKGLETKFQQCVETKIPVIYEEIFNFLGQARIGHTVLSPVLKEGKVVQIVGSTRDITEQKQAEDRIKYLSFYDDLTGLLNRTFFEDELKRLDIERQYPISVIMCDINGLKFVNDAFGRQEGDALLVSTAKIIEESCRSGDIVCRWGGDEFAVLLPRCAYEDAEKIVERIRNSTPYNERNLIPISLALGTATKDVGRNIQEVMKEAEDRMNRNKLLESKSSRSSTLASLQKTLQEKTHETEEHELRLQNLALKIGKAIGLSGSELDELVLLAALHDIGKVAVPDHVLKKPGPLTTEEWVIMRSHAEIGYRIALACSELTLISELILTHHERWDGSGYPKGLKKEEIPLLSRILSIIDAYDAMTNTRPYRKAITAEEAILELRQNAGRQFDPELVDIFIKTNQNGINS